MKCFRLLNIFTVLICFFEFAQANEILNCPAGYVLLNGLCYLDCQQRSTTSCNSAKTEMILTEQSTTRSSVIVEPATIRPEETTDAKMQCPPGSVFLKRQCRKIICPLGEFVAGRCLKVACPAGTVWREHSCKEPEYLTTILEIENVFLTEAHQSHGNITRVNTNYVNNNSSLSSITPGNSATTTSTVPPLVVKPTTITTERPPAAIIRPDCCTIHSPRLCKNYQRKWVCFNRRLKSCDRRVCLFPTMYLKTPKIAFKHNLLIMPPHPPLKACQERGCDSKTAIDCSGCTREERSNCSPYCYYYYCPNDTCGYMDLKDFCQIYPKHRFGCNQADGCIWDWCDAEETQ